jgi:adenosylcobinamide-GDP ribazoletransferase
MQPLRHFLLALQFFTRMPLPGRLARWAGYSPQMQQACLAYFPLVGALVGAAGAICFDVALRLLPDVGAAPWVAAVLGTIVTAMLTGAFHEDGLADLADGLGGHVGRERALEIMKDSRIGSYGAMALMLSLLLRIGLVVALAQVDPALAAWAWFAGHAFSRLMPVGVVAVLPYIRGDDAKSAITASRAGGRVMAGALFWALLALALACWRYSALFWIAGVAACMLAWAAMYRLLRRRLQGYTGDALGATQQVCELAFYLGLLLGVSIAGAA